MSFELVPSKYKMHDEFYSYIEKLKNILKSLYGFGGRCNKITDVCMDL